MITNDKKPLESISVLLVDDSPMNVLFARGILTRLGAIVAVADDGQQAIDQLASGRYQIILMDIQMPVMDGYEATKHIRAKGETIPIIAMTADGVNETLERVQAEGFDDILIKPVKADGLVDIILKYV